MTHIKRLPDHVTNKIAAGEVIERPASVVKELIENAIDAGCERVELRINEGGKEKIQVIDDGCGMSREDAAVAIERFSTSKIQSFEDLETLVTFGFRGEALASIAAVSIIELKTKTASEEEGTFLRAEGGKITQIKEIPWKKGTTITVRNLFFNTPARRKFQKTDLSETRQIYRVFRYYALAYPELYLSLYNDDRPIWRLQPAELFQRIIDVFDPGVKQYLIEVDYHDTQFSVSGYIGVPEWTRSTRTDQYLFLNKRFVKNRTVEHSVYQGYGQTLSHVSGHPFFVLMLSASPDKFDINIHPTKLEARFQDDRGVHHFISQAVRNALGTPQIDVTQPVEHFKKPVQEQQPSKTAAIPFEHHHASHEMPSVIDKVQSEPEFTDQTQRIKYKVDREKIWQVHQCYIFSQVKNGLIVIDQHTAHERILYEKALRMFNQGEKPSQQLLFPQTIQLSRDEIIILNELLRHLNKLGFEIKISDNNTAVIEAVPLEVRIGREIEVLRNIIEEYMKDEYKDLDLHDRLARSFACRSAIMKGDKLTPDEMYKLIDDLFATQFPFYCPHGRPTVIDISMKELNSRFYR
ncbi:hypothetical protein AMJ80_02270 [bacterium SM23_31]|nr:MAG: hypothetical protein AMJ80_02270 [bacterium SM23_31]